jgi:uncharacterized protein (UPF0548 family)
LKCSTRVYRAKYGNELLRRKGESGNELPHSKMTHVARLLAEQASSPFTYDGVGTTASTPPAGYTVDHTRVRLGSGPDVFNSARRALQTWEHIQLGWVSAVPRATPVDAGRVIAVQARVLGLWWVNPCRIVYVIDEPARYGFAYGTLPAHAESGEERFQVEIDPADGSVWYDILAFSRPRLWLARLAYPYTRRVQDRFARDSCRAMQRAAES